MIGENEFYEVYKPITNPVDKTDCWEWEHLERAGLLHGDRDGLIPMDDPDFMRLWTVVDGEEGGMYAIAGLHHVNRIYYVVTEVPWPSVDAEAIWMLPNCDECGFEYDPSDREEHCVEEGTCWDHCTDPAHKAVQKHETLAMSLRKAGEMLLANPSWVKE